jgi:hypothetical protein
MSNQTLAPGDPFLYMKVGVHAKETLSDILRRKREEIAKAGVAFWGYGGNTCHPLHAVQPFVRDVTARGITVRLLMQEINSRHFADPVRATHYSADGLSYIEVPPAINVLGSRYALVLGDLEEIDIAVALGDAKVGVGRMTGASGAGYIRGHVDKACLVYDPTDGADAKGHTIQLSLSARLVAPYAVLLK